MKYQKHLHPLYLKLHNILNIVLAALLHQNLEQTNQINQKLDVPILITIYRKYNYLKLTMDWYINELCMLKLLTT